MIFKTNTKVSINPRTVQQEFVYMNIWNVQKENDRYLGKIEYYWIKDIDTGDVDENNNPIIKHEKQFLESTTSDFSIAQARALQDMYYPNGLTGTYEDEYLDSLTEAVTNYQLNVTAPYGLDSSGWTKQ